MNALIHSYLFAYLYWLGLPLGAMGMLMVANLTGGRWSALTGSMLKSMTRTMGPMALLALPIAATLPRLYPWAATRSTLSPHKALFFSPVFFSARALVYFACWITLALGLTRWRDADRLRSLSAGGLVALGFTATFASIDWQMSLEPAWSSTIYGLLFITGQCLQSWAFAVAAICTWILRHPEQTPPARTLRDAGNLLLTLVVLWAYLAFMQYLIIWTGNLPEENSWVLARTTGGWQAVAVVLVLFQFAAPFAALLFRGSKENVSRLRAVAVCIIAARVVDQYWQVMPAFHPGRFESSATDAAAWLVVGCFWLLAFSRRSGARV